MRRYNSIKIKLSEKRYNVDRELHEKIVIIEETQTAMSNVIEQFTAERDKKLLKILKETNEHYSQLSAEIHEEKEKQILGYYKDHRDEQEDIIGLLTREVPKHIVSTSIDASTEHRTENQENTSDGATAERQSESNTTNTILSDEALRTQIYSTFSAYLNLLKEGTTDLSSGKYN